MGPVPAPVSPEPGRDRDSRCCGGHSGQDQHTDTHRGRSLFTVAGAVQAPAQAQPFGPRSRRGVPPAARGQRDAPAPPLGRRAGRLPAPRASPRGRLGDARTRPLGPRAAPRGPPGRCAVLGGARPVTGSGAAAGGPRPSPPATEPPGAAPQSPGTPEWRRHRQGRHTGVPCFPSLPCCIYTPEFSPRGRARRQTPC